MTTVHTNGTSPTKVDALLGAIGGREPVVLQDWALQQAPLLASLTTGEIERFYLALVRAGVTKSFVEKSLARVIRDTKGDGSDGSDGSETGGKGKQADKLVELLQERAVFFTGQDGEQYASVQISGHSECYRLKSNQFNDYLAQAFWLEHKSVIGGQARSDAKAVLSFSARERTEDVFVRVGHKAGKVYIDLGTPEWDAIEVDANGWRVVSLPPVHFRRTSAMRGLPLPAPSTDTAKLTLYLNIEDEHWPLVAAWIVAALHPTGPYPMLVLVGEQGTAKSTTLRVLKELIDPSAAALRGQPEDIRDLMIAANNSWLMAFDNVSSLRADVADALCRVSTGGGYARKANYTDGDEFIIDIMRPMAINGIGDIITRGDLIDRSLIISPPIIPPSKRQDEQTFWNAFNQDKPAILGAFLSALSIGLRNLPTTRLQSKPRMADFARLAVASEPAYRFDLSFEDAYNGNREEATDVGLDATSVVRPLRELIKITGSWTGTPTELYQAMCEKATNLETKSADWPPAANQLKTALQRLAPALRARGVDAVYNRTGAARKWTLTRIAETWSD